jgi:enoyl-[acyl-carrier protein] reductase III
VSTFAGATVLVTGGGRGIGKEIALRFAKLGAAKVAISYLRNDRAAEETAEELRAHGAEAQLLRGNVGDPDNVRELVEAAGPLNVLVSNAATGVIRPISELTEKHWDWTMNANARALFSLARHAAPSMPPGSSIIAISSLGSDRVLDNYALVGTSKAAIESLVRYLAVEYAPQGIRTNAVSAGLVDTGALDHFPDKETMLAGFRDRTPAGRLVEPPDIADAVVFLASPAADMIRGQTIVLDGGYSILA